jgi:hypothetical protein
MLPGATMFGLHEACVSWALSSDPMRYLLLVFGLFCGPTALAEPPSVQSVGVQGTEFVVTLTDGRSLRSRELVGAVLNVRFDGQPVRVRIAGVERDPDDQSHTVWLHTLEALQTDGSWANLCPAGPDGRRQSFPLEGTAKGVELTCTAGAIGKCVRFGYRPWANESHGQSLRSYHEACTRLVRADYGGLGEGTTSTGMLIDIFDSLGIQTLEPAPELAFEAGWAAGGAVCVHHVRVKTNETLEALEQKYPALKGRTGSVCTLEFAREHGATLFNLSKD